MSLNKSQRQTGMTAFYKKQILSKCVEIKMVNLSHRILTNMEIWCYNIIKKFLKEVNKMDEIKEILKILKKGQDELKFGQEEMREEFTKGLRETNQRLAAFQEDITKKVNILLDADKARQELLEIHDAQISEISKTQFEHSTKINILEQKVG